MTCPNCGYYCTDSSVFCTPPIKEPKTAAKSEVEYVCDERDCANEGQCRAKCYAYIAPERCVLDGDKCKWKEIK